MQKTYLEMKLRALIALTVFLTCLSCKNESDKTTSKTDSTVTEAEIEVDKDLLKVSFDLIIKKDDNLHLYYTEDGTINFNEKQSLWIPVKGSENTQNITFKLPKDVLPTALRVDFGFGKNIEQSDVELKTFSLKYYDKKVEASGVEILNYFYPMKENTEIILGTSTLKRLSKDQESGPILYPQILLSEKLQEITKGN